MRVIPAILFAFFLIASSAQAATTATYGSTGAGPYAVAIDAIGNVYTANNTGNSISKITPLAYTIQGDVSYDLGSPPSDLSRNKLDIYMPDKSSPRPRPIILFIHGGGWRFGDKNNASTPDKAALFTGLGYGFVAINYRLSPAVGDLNNLDPNRIMFPDHPHDVGEAIGWLQQNALSYGLDPDRIILIGHSAGAHLASLVSTDPRYIERYGVDQRQILGTVSLDTAAFDIEQSILSNDDPEILKSLFINAFGTAQENIATGNWSKASPLFWADQNDPRHLFQVQNTPYRINRQMAMADKLNQNPSSVLPLPLDHNGINQAIGNPADDTEATPSLASFISERLVAYKEPSVKITSRPPRTLYLGKKLQKKVVFRFKGLGSWSSLQCRLNKRAFKPCISAATYRISVGKYVFQVRSLYPSGRPASAKEAKVTIRK